MIEPNTASANRSRGALTSLSATGAAVGGFGAGVLFAGPLAVTAWPARIAGLAVYLFGMVGLTRLRATGGYRPSASEKLDYLLCWVVIAALLAYAAMELFR